MSDKNRRKEIAEAVRLIRNALEEMGGVKNVRLMETDDEDRVPQRDTGETIH